MAFGIPRRLRKLLENGKVGVQKLRCCNDAVKKGVLTEG